MRLAKVLGLVGRALIWAGTIVLLFVAYQLWGTSLAEARAQDDLESKFTERLDEAEVTPVTTTPTTAGVSTTTAPSTTTTTTTTRPSLPPPPDDGEAVARMQIPAIGIDKIVVEGVSREDLQKGPGHYPGTPLPGQPGNSAIAGHRTTYGAPFHRVDELEPGDEILVTTLQGTFRYEVAGHEIVSPDRVDVIEDQGDDRLTLTSCHPKYSARQRIIVSALLVDEPAATGPTTTTTTVVENSGDDPDELVGEDLPDADEDEGDEEIAGRGPDRAPPGEGIALESLDAGETRTAGPAVLWGSVAAAVWLAFYVLSRVWRRWPSYLLGTPVFLVALFVFFQAFSDLLPANF